MKIRMEFCGICNFEPKAQLLAQKIKERLGDQFEFEFVRSDGGVFEVHADEHYVYSKQRTGKHPDLDAVVDSIAKLL